MVRLDRIYTRGGDGGETSLGDGSRVPKDDVRIVAIGAIEEANAAIGAARLHTGAAPDADAMLERMQQDLFDVGADLCVPDPSGDCLRIAPAQVKRLENEIDAMNAGLKPLTSFVLPGGTPAAAQLHMARTILRRAEQAVVALNLRDGLNDALLQYVNRASDHLFVLCRVLNAGEGDVLWRPGANRS